MTATQLRLTGCAAVCTLAAALAAACGATTDQAGSGALRAVETPLAVAPPTTTSTSHVTCADPTASLRPSGALPAPRHMRAGTFMRRIQRRGRLIAGVDQNTLLFAYLNPLTGRLEGFEIDLLRQIAKAIFGSPNAIEFKAVTTTQRLPAVENGSVDIVADAVTINCDRLQDVDFSTVYYDAGQRVLVPDSSRARGIQDLGGQRVCATAGSTSIANIAAAPSHPIPYAVPQRTDCLVALQEGKVAAISTDDAILFGFEAQDPYTKLVGPRFSDEPYGMAISKQHPGFVRYVNAVLERLRRDGTWAALYRKWLGGVSNTTPAPPVPQYRPDR
jgi:polar amino acid transport system substrate-binding protein